MVVSKEKEIKRLVAIMNEYNVVVLFLLLMVVEIAEISEIIVINL